MVVWFWGKSLCFRFKISHWSPTPNSKNQTWQPAAFQDPRHEKNWSFFVHVNIVNFLTYQPPNFHQTSKPNYKRGFTLQKTLISTETPTSFFTHHPSGSFWILLMFTKKNTISKFSAVFFPNMFFVSFRQGSSCQVSWKPQRSRLPVPNVRAVPYRDLSAFCNVGILGSKTGKGGVTWMSRWKLGSMVDKRVITYL